MTIEEFIEARLVEDEQFADAVAHGPARLEPGWVAVDYEANLGDRFRTVSDSSGVFLVPELGRIADHIARHDPVRVLRQCAALRATLEFGSGLVSACQQIEFETDVVPHLAAIWSDHPNYQSEWAADGGGSKP